MDSVGDQKIKKKELGMSRKYSIGHVAHELTWITGMIEYLKIAFTNLLLSRVIKIDICHWSRKLNGKFLDICLCFCLQLNINSFINGLVALNSIVQKNIRIFENRTK